MVFIGSIIFEFCCLVNGEQALDKPWTSESSNNDCSECLNDVHCNQFITVNIDIMSVSTNCLSGPS